MQEGEGFCIAVVRLLFSSDDRFEADLSRVC